MALTFIPESQTINGFIYIYGMLSFSLMVNLLF